VLLALLALLSLGGGCIVDDLSDVGRPCPCGPETVCDKAIGRCVPAGDGRVGDAGGGEADGGGVDAVADQGRTD
jgi:hypothetical protein